MQGTFQLIELVVYSTLLHPYVVLSLGEILIWDNLGL